MKETPVLYSLPMVDAIWDYRKTMTRRVIKPQPPFSANEIGKDYGFDIDGSSGKKMGYAYFEGEKQFHNVVCPYGKPDDLLWVKEPYYAYGYWVENGLTKKFKQKYLFQDFTIERGHQYLFENNKPNKICNTNAKRDGLVGWFKRPSIFMPKAAARLWLQIEEIRVERLQDISHADAIAEGIYREWDGSAYWYMDYRHRTLVKRNPNESFRTLWKSIHGDSAWDNNPWLWVISFREISRTGKPQLETSNSKLQTL